MSYRVGPKLVLKNISLNSFLMVVSGGYRSEF